MPKVVIVGAGINGLAVARSLLRRGWQVEILERGPIPNPAAASSDRHRLIRAHYPGGTAYAARMPAAFAAWDRLWADLGRAHYHERGVAALSRAAGDRADRMRAASAGGAIPLEVIGPEALAARLPVFDAAGVRFALLSRRGGVLMADRILADLAAWLAARGAVLRPDFPVAAVDAAAGTATGPAGTAAGDVVVVAAGVGLVGLVPEHVAGFRANRCTVLWLDPPRDLAAAWAEAPGWVDLGMEDDLWGIPPVEDLPLKLGYGRHTAPGDPEREREATGADVAAILGAYRGRIVGIQRFALRAAAANFYLMAPDERFLLVRDRRLVVLTADSGHGFKFGPLTGEDVAEALDGGDFAAVARRLAGHADAPAAAG